MAIEQFLNEAETIYKLVLARQIDIDLAVYMAKRLEQRSKDGADYKRVFRLVAFILSKYL